MLTTTKESIRERDLLDYTYQGLDIMSGIAIGSPSLDHFDIENIEPPPLDDEDENHTTTQNEIPHSPNNNNNNIPTSEQQQATSESAIIMHRIASYLSINDAENMSITATSAYSRQSTQFPHTRSRSNSTQHSLDYVQYTTNNRNSKVSPLGNSCSYRSRSNSMNNQNQHLRANSSTTLNGDNRSNVDSSLDEEDWFVGGQHSINSLNMGGGSSRGHNGGLTPHPRVVTLMPLEELGEEGQGEQQIGIARDNNNPATAALEQQQQLLEGNSPEEELSLWTPAGQNTSESEDGLNNSASSREMLLPPGTVISSVHSEITTHVNDDSPTPPLRSTPKQPGFFTQRKQQRLQKQALQNKLAAAVFSHPHPLRDYCLDAYSTALSLSMSRQKKYEESCNNAIIENSSSSKVLFQQNTQQQQIELRGRIHMSHQDILHFIFKHLLSNIPLSVLFDFIENTCNLSIETIIASSKLGSMTISKSISILCDVSFIILDIVCKIPNPFHVFEFVVGVQKSAIGKTSDVLVTGIQSVATGVGSVSNAALNRLSRSGLALVGDRVVNASDRGSRSGVYVGKDVNVNENILESKVSIRFVRGCIVLCLLLMMRISHTPFPFSTLIIILLSSSIDCKRWKVYPNL